MKILLTLLLAVAFSLAGAPLHAETQFIKYKKYLIPISTSLRPADNALKPRVIITTDLSPDGDQDDHQTMVHALLNSDKFDLRGIVASIPGADTASGTLVEIQDIIRAYQADFDRSSNSLNSANKYVRFPLSIVSLGRTSALPNANPSLSQVQDPSGNISDGAQRIIDEVYADTSTPLYVLGWGSLTDLATAVIADPGIVPYLRIISVGSTNSGYRPCCPDFDPYARDYLYSNYTQNSDEDMNLWWVEMETAFRGLYGVDSVLESYEAGSNSVFNHVSERGCLGEVWLEHDKPGVPFPYQGNSTRPFSGDYLTTLFVMDPPNLRNNPQLDSNSGKYYNSTTAPALHWTERNEDSRGTACGQENNQYGRGGNSCWGAEYIYQKAQNEIANDFKAVSNRLEPNQSYCP